MRDVVPPASHREAVAQAMATPTTRTSAGYSGPTYSIAPREYICNTCGFRYPIGRENDMGWTEGAPTMLRHLRDEHGYQPRNPIRDWQERIEPRRAAVHPETGGTG